MRGLKMNSPRVVHKKGKSPVAVPVITMDQNPKRIRSGGNRRLAVSTRRLIHPRESDLMTSLISAVKT